MKKRRIRAAATINPPHLPEKKRTENKAKQKHKKREERAQTHSFWSPTAAVNSILKHPLTHCTKTGKRGLEPDSYQVSKLASLNRKCVFLFLLRLPRQHDA